MNVYIAYIHKVLKSCNKLSNEMGICQIWVYWDYFWCFFRHGCLIDQYTRGHFYQMTEVIRRKAFTQRRLERVIRFYNDSSYIHLLKNKNEFNEFFKDYIRRSWLYSKKMTKESFHKLVENNDELFIKPLDNQEGHGVYKVKTGELNWEHLYRELILKDVIIETVIKQHKKLMFGNKSVNSARILTVIDSSGSAHVLRAGLRVGVGDSFVDNYSAGGVLYEIDIETGIIDHKGIQGSNYDILFHPGTEFCMLGFEMPYWEEAIISVKKAAESISSCKFIGWDVAFTPEGIELIEGNHNPGLFTMESLGTPGAYYETIKIINS